MIELVPFDEVDPNQTGSDIFELLQEDSTREQLAQYLPEFLNRYGNTPEGAISRFKEATEMSQDDNFDAYVQTVNDEIVGTATIDATAVPYRYRPVPGVKLGKIAVIGPATSSWISSEQQGQGYGRESLVRRVEIAELKLGYRGVWAKVKESNEKSRSNLAGREFEPVHSDPFWYGGVKYTDSMLVQHLAE